MTTIIVRSRPDQTTERPYLARAQRVSHGRKGYTYRPLWAAEREQALEMEPAEARTLLAWLRKSRLTAGYQYGAAGIDDAPPERPDHEDLARRQRLVLEALTELGAAGGGALARRCGLSRYQVTRALNHLRNSGAVTRSEGQFNGTWRATVPYLVLDGETFDGAFDDRTS